MFWRGVYALLDDHFLRSRNVLPPVVMDPVFAPCHAWKMAEPPLVVGSDIAISPFS